MPWSSSPSQSTCLFCFVLIPLFPGQFSYPEASHTRWQSYSPADDDSHHRHTISHNGWTSANTGSLNDTVPEQSVSAMVKDPLSFVVVSHPIIVSCLARTTIGRVSREPCTPCKYFWMDFWAPQIERGIHCMGAGKSSWREPRFLILLRTSLLVSSL